MRARKHGSEPTLKISRRSHRGITVQAGLSSLRTRTVHSQVPTDVSEDQDQSGLRLAVPRPHTH